MELDRPIQNLVLVQVLGMSMTMTTTKGRLRTRSKFALIDSKGTTEPRQVHEEQKSVTPLLLLVRLLFHHLGTGSGGAATVTSPVTGFHVLRNWEL